ncbi:hypothetical protein ElyMa_001219000 [Elysia marginata]|uniref:Uncharacterized protein n=1 Tax=Elysia marginata TaxID=1093978 RepID=A0AAV4I732_9GAST|nr:hypothetical protein ElyMa_001219000 [Elysia marginata]
MQSLFYSEKCYVRAIVVVVVVVVVVEGEVVELVVVVVIVEVVVVVAAAAGSRSITSDLESDALPTHHTASTLQGMFQTYKNACGFLTDREFCIRLEMSALVNWLA